MARKTEDSGPKGKDKDKEIEKEREKEKAAAKPGPKSGKGAVEKREKPATAMPPRRPRA